MMDQSLAVGGSASNPSGKRIGKVTWQKLRDNALTKTEFYDISQQSKLLPELRTDSVIFPQLEALEFYGRGEVPNLEFPESLERECRSSDDDTANSDISGSDGTEDDDTMDSDISEGEGSEKDYVPQTTMFYRSQYHERESGYRREISLKDILESYEEGQISFIGQAGSGKTTLLKAITRQVIEGKYKNLSSIEMVHFVHLRTFKRNDFVTPAELLFRNVTPEMSDEEMKEAMQYAKENPEKVLFVIDSLDTVPYTIDGVYTGITTDDRASPEAILFHLLSGNLFPGCRFITSSREHAICNYKGDVQAKLVIALAGLSKESMKTIVVGYVGEEKAEEKMTYLKRKPVIESLCATPVWLIFTLMVLSIKSNFTPTTMAGILVLLLQNMVRSEHVNEGNIEVVLGKLGKMAFTGTKEHRVEFSLDELRNFNLLESEIRDLMIATPSGEYQQLILGDSILMYTHQCLQEVLSAFHIAKMNLKEFQEFISEYIHQPHYAVVRRLLAGILLNNEVFEEAENFFEDATDFEQKRLCFKQSLDDQLKSDLSNEDQLELYMCLSETGDGAKDIIWNKIDKFDFARLSLSPSDIYSIGWVTSLQTFIPVLDLTGCNLTLASVSALYHALEGSNVQFHELNVSLNKALGPDEIKLIVKIFIQCKVKVLNLGGCEPKSDALKAFLDSSVGTKVHKLDISYNTSLGPDEMTLIAKIFVQCEVKVLKLVACELKPDALKAFLDSSDGVKLDELDVSYNTFGPDEMMVIAQICKQRKVDGFRICHCKFHPGALKSFLLHSVGAKISLLDIGYTGYDELIRQDELSEDDKTLLGRIIKRCGVESLMISYPVDLGAVDIEAFKISSDNFKISKLGCGKNYQLHKGRCHLVRTACGELVSKFLPYVATEVILVKDELLRREVEILQKRLDEGRNKGLKITLKNCTLFDSEEDRKDKESEKGEEVEHKVLECKEAPAENVPSIVENRRAQLNNDGSVTVSWHYPDEEDVHYHVETFCNDQPTGNIEICRDPYYQCKTCHPSQVYCFKIWVVDSSEIAGDAMFTNEVTSGPLLMEYEHMKFVGEEIPSAQAETGISMTGSVLKAVHQQYRRYDREHEDPDSHDHSHPKRIKLDEASTSAGIEHYDQVPFGKGATYKPGDESESSENEDRYLETGEPEYPGLCFSAVTEKLLHSAEGGDIDLYKCKIRVPPGSLKNDFRAKLKVETGNTHDKPEGSIPISPAIESQLELKDGFEMDVEVPTFCFATEPVEVHLFTRSLGSTDWVVEKTMTLGQERKLRFKTSRFSRKLFVILSSLYLEKVALLLHFPLTPHLYYNGDRKFHSFFCLDHDIWDDKLRQKHSELKDCIGTPQRHVVKIGDKFEAKLLFEDPNLSNFLTNGSTTFDIKKDLIKCFFYRRDFNLKKVVALNDDCQDQDPLNDDCQDQDTDMFFDVGEKGSEPIRMAFSIPWPPRAPATEEKKKVPSTTNLPEVGGDRKSNTDVLASDNSSAAGRDYNVTQNIALFNLTKM